MIVAQAPRIGIILPSIIHNVGGSGSVDRNHIIRAVNAKPTAMLAAIASAHLRITGWIIEGKRLICQSVEQPRLSRTR